MVCEIDMRSSGWAPSRQRTALGMSKPGFVSEENGAAVGADRFKDQIEDQRREGVDIKDIADGLSRTVHDREVQQPFAQPAGGGVGSFEHARAFVRRDALQNGRPVVGTALGQQIDAGGQIADACGGDSLVKQHDGLAELNPVAGMHNGVVDGLAVDESPVRRAQIDDAIAVAVRA